MCLWWRDGSLCPTSQGAQRELLRDVMSTVWARCQGLNGLSVAQFLVWD